MRELHFESMDAMLEGFDKAANALAGTIGPKGRNVFIKGTIPRITNDGAKISHEIIFRDELKDSGAYIIRNVSAQQNDDVGDGTTTVAVLTKAILHEVLRRPESPMTIGPSLKEAGEKVLKSLAKRAKKLDKKDIYKVALISAEHPELAKLITEIVGKLGDKAVINVEDSKTFATDYEIRDGFEVHVGFMSPRFITEKKSARAIYQDIPVLCTEKKISSIADIAPIFDMFAFETKDGKIVKDLADKPVPSKNPITSCVIVCDDIDDSMLGIFVRSFEMKTFNALVIRANSMLLDDIAGYTGSTIISNSTGVSFQNFKREHLGFCKKIISDANKTLFIGDGKRHLEYADALAVKAEGEPNMYTQKNIQTRVAKLRGGIAVLRIGASTDTEREPLKDKAEDAVKATQAALAEGIVEGGGITLYRLASELTPKTVGEEILKKALTAPLKQIVENCDKDYAEIIKNMPDGLGYDAKEDRYVPMLSHGIIDPVKVTRCALENSVSAISKFMTVFLTITDDKDPAIKN